jgi:homoserine O-succinyltransferase
VFDCVEAADSWLTRDLPSPLKICHSRLNGLPERNLVRSGYRVLTRSAETGVDIFTKAWQSQFVFFQGHPEYDALSLQREYLRDVARYLSGERDAYPEAPQGYFDAATEARLGGFRRRAALERTPALAAELPALTLRSDIAAGSAAAALFRNWTEYLAEGALVSRA